MTMATARFAGESHGDYTTRMKNEVVRLQNANAELRGALRMLVGRCEESGWPVLAEDMAPLHMARAAITNDP